MTNNLARYALTIPSAEKLIKRYVWVEQRNESMVLLQVTVTHTPSPFTRESVSDVQASSEQSDPVLYRDLDSANAAARQINEQLINEGWQPYIGEQPHEKADPWA